MDDANEYDVDKSIRSFRRAGSRVIEGVAHLYHGGKDRISDQHAVVQCALTMGLWFAGNWIYNRIAPSIIDLFARAVTNVPTESMLTLVFGLLSGDFALSTAQLPGISTGVLLGHNQLQTQRVKRIGNNVIAMSGGVPRRPMGEAPSQKKSVAALVSVVQSWVHLSVSPSDRVAYSLASISGTSWGNVSPKATFPTVTSNEPDSSSVGAWRPKRSSAQGVLFDLP